MYNELKEKGRIYTWNDERAKAIGASTPKNRMCMIDKYLDDLFATGFTTHYLWEVNAALPFYPMLMYSLIRSNVLKNVLEIGLYQGYTAYYLAKAAAINGGLYYGIDIDPRWCSFVSNHMLERNLEHTILQADTKDIKDGNELKSMLQFKNIDFAFLDGEHTSEAALHEIELIYPNLNSSGYGFICMHDVYGSGVDYAWAALKEDKRFESLVLPHSSGLGILRKVEFIEKDIERAKRCGRMSLGCQMGETIEQMEERHKQGDFYTDYVDSPFHDELMRKAHPEMDNYPDFVTSIERKKRYGG